MTELSSGIVLYITKNSVPVILGCLRFPDIAALKKKKKNAMETDEVHPL